ncbi:hypothetical protein BDN67DRAFT_133303 [Paxillus ammoniavirescens]|nr:hypothetical protein BDN67DRAFT_133303 [Paxillus ammoniavirescens]
MFGRSIDWVHMSLLMTAQQGLFTTGDPPVTYLRLFFLPSCSWLLMSVGTSTRSVPVARPLLLRMWAYLMPMAFSVTTYKKLWRSAGLSSNPS